MVRSKAWDNAVVYRDGRVQRAPLTDLMKPARLVDPNHRWVMSAGLALAEKCFPDLSEQIKPVIESYLAEGFDINDRYDWIVAEELARTGEARLPNVPVVSP